MDSQALGSLLHWVREREAIRLRKDRGDPFPWTDDPILQAYRFCCVRREDDRVTRWIDENIRRVYAGHPHLWFMLCAARQINWPDTLNDLMWGPDSWPIRQDFTPEAMGRRLEARAARGEKVFTGAYIITAPGDKGAKKTTFVAEQTLGGLWRDRERVNGIITWPWRSLQATHAELMRYPGWGPFLAYQAVVDMRFCPQLLESAPDIDTWAAAGPGTIRGLNRVHGRPVDAPLSQEQALAEIQRLHPQIWWETEVALDFSDVPNVLCETDKYLRVKHGEGTPRARYVPGRGS